MDNNVLCVSIPFTWDLPVVRARLEGNQSLLFSAVMVGGPAVALMPGYFNHLSFVVESWRGGHSDGVLQRVNPLATKTSVGCVNHCRFCAVPTIEGNIRELEDWPDLPIICDNNLLACSQQHFDKVMDRLARHKWCDFNQGIDARILTAYHAERLSRLNKPMIRLALDNINGFDVWEEALDRLSAHGIPKSRIRSYALIGFNDDPATAWRKCELIEGNGIKVLPMWFHSLKALEHNVVTKEQEDLGWSDYERRRIMQWFYKHKEAVSYV